MPAVIEHFCRQVDAYIAKLPIALPVELTSISVSILSHANIYYVGVIRNFISETAKEHLNDKLDRLLVIC
jgi:hypothetical protein